MIPTADAHRPLFQPFVLLILMHPEEIIIILDRFHYRLLPAADHKLPLLHLFAAGHRSSPLSHHPVIGSSISGHAASV